MGDGDISYILWLQRVVAGGSEVERFNETNERFPNSKVWALTAEIGQATLGEASVSMMRDARLHATHASDVIRNMLELGKLRRV